MTKKYFLAFDWYDDNGLINKFWYGIVDVDLNEIHLKDVCRQVIKDTQWVYLADNGLTVDDIIVKVTAFNNVEV